MLTTSNSTDERLEARISTEQKRLFKEAATLRGVTLTDFVISSVHEAAVRTLEARHVIDLSQKDQRAFVDALSRPPAPTSVLRKAWARHSASRARSRKRRFYAHDVWLERANALERRREVGGGENQRPSADRDLVAQRGEQLRFRDQNGDIP